MKIHTRKNAIHSLMYDGVQIKEEPEKPQDNGKAVELAKSLNRTKRVNPDDLKKWQ